MSRAKRLFDQIVRVTLALALLPAPTYAAAVENEVAKVEVAKAEGAQAKTAWGQAGWPDVPAMPVADTEWTGGDRNKRPRGPDGKSPVYFTGVNDANGRPVVVSTNAQGEFVEATLPLNPGGNRFRDAVKFNAPDFSALEGFDVAPGKAPGRLATKLLDLRAYLAKRRADVKPPEWGVNGWPALPANPVADQEWTGGRGTKAPTGPDGYSSVHFTGQTDASGRPTIYSTDERSGKMVEASVPERPVGKRFSATTTFTAAEVAPLIVDGAPIFEPDRPSNLQRSFRWSKRNTAQALRGIREVLTGQKAWTDLKRVDIGGSAAKTVEVMNTFPVSSLSFGLALGVSAAYTLMSDYPNNPLVWSKYMETMADPIGWMSLAGFIIGMAPATRFLNSPGAPKSFVGQVPIFVTGLALGTLVQTGIDTFARDEDVSACMGFTNRWKTGSFFDNSRDVEFKPFKPHDYKACDRAYAKFKSGELASEVLIKAIPNIAAVAVSGSVFYGILYALQRSPGVQRAMTSIGMAAGNTWVGMALRGTYAIGTTVLFLAMVSKPQEWMGTAWDNYLLASGGKEGPVYGKTIERAENDVFQTWERVRKSGWQDQDAMESVKSVCYDERRIGGKYYDCQKPRELDFAGTLETYKKTQTAWRTNQLRPTLMAYQDWTNKVGAYRELYQQTADYYKKAIEKIIYTREHPNAPADDPMVFNEKNMDIRTVSPVLPEFFRSLVARLDMVESHDGAWMHVSTPRLQEFITTSMACGPEVEGRSEGGFTNNVLDFVGSWITGNSAPREMIEDEQGWIWKTKGYKVIFHPPRITNPLPGTIDTICEKVHEKGWSKRIMPARFFWNVVDWFAPATLDKFEVVANGKQYDGLLGYIQDNVRATVINGRNVSQFESWWQDFVGRQNAALGKSMSEDYAKVVEGPFKAALRNPSYYWCEQNQVAANTSLETYLGKLRLPGEACGAQRTHRLARGVMNNLRDQARMYIAMMVDLYVSNSGMLTNPLASDTPGQAPRYPTSVAQIENTVLVPARELLEAYDAYANEVIDGTDPAKAEAVGKAITESYRKFLRIVHNEGDPGLTLRGQKLQFGVAAEAVKVAHTGKIAILPARPNMQSAWMSNLSKSLLEVLGEWETYSRIAAMQ